jgi:tetratricopeptide (TPR) repeat protein
MLRARIPVCLPPILALLAACSGARQPEPATRLDTTASDYQSPWGEDPAEDAGPPAEVATPVTPRGSSALGSLVRDPRGGRPPRATALVATEQQGLERLLQSTPRQSPDRPLLLRRIAEGYVELAASSDTKPALQKAIEYYSTLVRDYPSYVQIDEVLYYRGLACERAGDLQEARRSYFELIQKAPTSSFVPLAYLAFGELFFAEATADPSKWDLADAAFSEVLKYPPPKNVAACYARYRLGLGRRQLRGRDAAAATLRDASECTRSFPALPESAEVGQAAERAMALAGP